ncbi:MAG: hypothetical protein HFJ66_08325 [Eggerthellaceae bacterium]|nr:hypothetical protein [Eggerthellaceae bacterium]
MTCSQIKGYSVLVFAAVALVLCCLFMQGCSSEERAEESNASTAEKAPSSAESTTDEGGSSSESGISVESQGFSYSLEAGEIAGSGTVLDNEVIAVKAISVSAGLNGLDISLEITNNTDQAITVTAETLGYAANYVNRYMINGGYLNVSLSAAETSACDLFIGIDDLVLSGIQKVGEIGIGFSVSPDNSGRESADYSFDNLYRGIAVIKTSLYDEALVAEKTFSSAMKSNEVLFDRLGVEVERFADQTVFDQNGITILSDAILKNEAGDTLLVFEVANNNSSPVQVFLGNLSADGSELYSGAWAGEYIAPGKIALVSANLSTVLGSVAGEDGAATLDDIKEFSFLLNAIDESENVVIGGAEITYALPA